MEDDFSHDMDFSVFIQELIHKEKSLPSPVKKKSGKKEWQKNTNLKKGEKFLTYYLHICVFSVAGKGKKIKKVFFFFFLGIEGEILLYRTGREYNKESL